MTNTPSVATPTPGGQPLPLRVIRSVFVVALFAIGALLLFSANVGYWVRGDIYDSEGFTDTTSAVFEDEDVQQALAEEFALIIYNSSDLTGLIGDELPERLQFLATPLSNTMISVLERGVLRIIQTDAVQAALRTSLEVAHAGVLRIIRSDSISTDTDSIVIDLRPVIQEVVERIGLEVDLDETLVDETLITRLDLPPDAGRFTIENAAASWLIRLGRYGEQIIIGVLVAAIVMLALAVGFARNRRSALRNAGIIVAVVGLISLALMIPVRVFTSEMAEHTEAAGSIVDIVTERFRMQSVLLVVVGVIIAAVAFLLGESRLARSIRGIGRTPADGGSRDFTQSVRENATPLRIIGLVGGAIVLLAWPDPTTRVQVTILTITAIYLAFVWAIASDTSPAATVRANVSAIWSRNAGVDAPENTGWFARNAGTLRVVGIAVAAACIVLVPSLTFGSIVAIVALALIYLAAVDFLANRQEA